MQRRPITRTRELLACAECRRRKLRCDRQTPCSTCVRRGEPGNCSYQRYANGLETERERRVHAEARLEHLESLVQQLAQSGATQAQPPATELTGTDTQHSIQANNGNGPQLSPSDNVAYSGSTHWSAMLEDIDELRSVISPADIIDMNGAAVEDENDEGTDVLFGAGTALTYEQILAQYLPPRQEVDRLIAAYFRSSALGAPFIHALQFRRAYSEFWENPLLRSPLWTSILFSVCHVASSGKHSRYCKAAAHCLAIGHYTRPRKFSVEALLLYIQSRLFTRLDIPPDIGIHYGLLMRLATSQGYHRDPDNFPGLSVFEGEMRRRTWSMCMQLDLLISFQLGLPSNVQFPTWDTRLPRNLIDSDLEEDMSELPPERPASEWTDIIFYITKHKVMVVFEKIVRCSLTPDSTLCIDPDILDNELEAVYTSLPEVYSPRPMTDSVIDSASLILTRTCVQLIYEKSRCALHRRYVTQGRLKSIRTCYEAACNIVLSFIDLYYEFEPGGQTAMDRWFMSAITWHDLLLGINALCLVLCATAQSNTDSSVGIDVSAGLGLLQKAQRVCADQVKRSRDTQRVCKLLEAMDQRFGRKYQSTPSNVSSNGISAATQPIYPVAADVASSTTFNGSWTDADMPGGIQDADDDWADLQRPIDDISWTYLEQFLNMSPDDPMTAL